MKTSGLLDSKTDPAELAKKAWLDLDGVTDDWVKGLRDRKGRRRRPPSAAIAGDAGGDVRGQEACCSCCVVIGSRTPGNASFICPWTLEFRGISARCRLEAELQHASLNCPSA